MVLAASRGLRLTTTAQGPVIADNMPEAASKEELQKRTAELNKK